MLRQVGLDQTGKLIPGYHEFQAISALDEIYQKANWKNQDFRDPLARLRNKIFEQIAKSDLIETPLIEKILTITSKLPSPRSFFGDLEFKELVKESDWDRLIDFFSEKKEDLSLSESEEEILIAYLNAVFSLNFSTLNDLAVQYDRVFQKIKDKIESSPTEDIRPLLRLAKSLFDLSGHIPERGDFSFLESIFNLETKDQYLYFCQKRALSEMRPDEKRFEVEKMLNAWKGNQTLEKSILLSLLDVFREDPFQFPILEFLSVEEVCLGAHHASIRLLEDFDAYAYYKEFMQEISALFLENHQSDLRIIEIYELFSIKDNQNFLKQIDHPLMINNPIESNLLNSLQSRSFQENDLSTINLFNSAFSLELSKIQDLFDPDLFFTVLDKLCEQAYVNKSLMPQKMNLLNEIVILLLKTASSYPRKAMQVSPQFLEKTALFCEQSILSCSMEPEKGSYFEFLCKTLEDEQVSYQMLSEWKSKISLNLMGEEEFYQLSHALKQVEEAKKIGFLLLDRSGIQDAVKQLWENLKEFKIDPYLMRLFDKIIEMNKGVNQSIHKETQSLEELQSIFKSSNKEELIEKIVTSSYAKELKISPWEGLALLLEGKIEENPEYAPQQEIQYLSILKSFLSIYATIEQNKGSFSLLKDFQDVLLDKKTKGLLSSSLLFEDLLEISRSESYEELERKSVSHLHFCEIIEAIHLDFLLALSEKKESTQAFQKALDYSLRSLGGPLFSDLSDVNSFQLIFLKLKEKILETEEEDISKWVELGRFLLETGSHFGNPEIEEIEALLTKNTKSELIRLLNFQGYIHQSDSLKIETLDLILENWLCHETQPMHLYLWIDLLKDLLHRRVDISQICFSSRCFLAKVYKVWEDLRQNYQENIESKEFVETVACFLIESLGENEQRGELFFIFSAPSEVEFIERMEASSCYSFFITGLDEKKAKLLDFMESNQTDNEPFIPLLQEAFPSLIFNTIEDLTKTEHLLPMFSRCLKQALEEKNLTGPEIRLLTLLMDQIEKIPLLERNQGTNWVSFSFTQKMHRFFRRAFSPSKLPPFSDPWINHLLKSVTSDNPSQYFLKKMTKLLKKGELEETGFFVFLDSLNQLKKKREHCPIEITEKELIAKIQVLWKNPNVYDLRMIFELLCWQYRSEEFPFSFILQSASEEEFIQRVCLSPSFPLITGKGEEDRLKVFLDSRAQSELSDPEYQKIIFFLLKRQFNIPSSCTSLSDLYKKENFTALAKSVFESVSWGNSTNFGTLCSFLERIRDPFSSDPNEEVSSYLLQESGRVFEGNWTEISHKINASPYFSRFFSKKNLFEAIEKAEGRELFYLLADFAKDVIPVIEMERIQKAFLNEFEKLEETGYDVRLLQSMVKLSGFFRSNPLIEEVKRICEAEHKEEFEKRLYTSSLFHTLCPQVSVLRHFQKVLKQEIPLEGTLHLYRQLLEEFPQKKRLLEEVQQTVRSQYVFSLLAGPDSRITERWNKMVQIETFLQEVLENGGTFNLERLESLDLRVLSSILDHLTPGKLIPPAISFLDLQIISQRMRSNPQEFSESGRSLFLIILEKILFEEPLNKPELLFMKEIYQQVFIKNIKEQDS